MSNSKNYNKNFGTILTNETDKPIDKGGEVLMHANSEVEKSESKNILNTHQNDERENDKNNMGQSNNPTKNKPEEIIGTGYDNDFIDVHSYIKHGVGNVEGIFDDGKLFKDDFKNYGKYDVKEKEVKHEEVKHEEVKECEHGGKNNGHWTCEDVLCDTEFSCECDPIGEALADIVESIAHQENGIAKILDSESKKICKAICMAECVDDLIKVNKSVQDTIKQINNVQIVLIGKLQEVSDICDGCCEDDCGR